MRTIRTMMLLAVTASLAVAFASPVAAAASNWTKEGSPLVSELQWSDTGVPLTNEATTTVSGTFGFETEVGGASCTANGTVTLEKGGALGHVTKFDLSNCAATGVLKLAKCTVSSGSANSLPWLQYAKTSGGTRVLYIENATFTYKVEKCGKGFPSELVVSGALTATPDNSKQISTLSLSGTMKSTLGAAEASGSLGVSPAARYGIIGKDVVALSGSLGYQSEFGGVSCAVNALLLLESGSKGEVISFDQGSCGTSGTLTLQCGPTASLAATSLPWSVVDEGSVIRLTSVPMTITYPSKCGPTSVTGELLATPDNTFAIKSTKLAGTLLTGGIKQSWSGEVSWTPSGIYGL